MKTIALLAALLLPACLIAQTVKRTRTFDEGILTLEASAGVNVFLTQGNAESVRIDARGFAENEIIADVQGDKLVLSTRRQGGNWSFGSLGKSRYVNAYVTVRNLNTISVSSGADLTGETTFTADDLTISTSSGADLKLAVKTNRLTISVSSGADATLSGSTGKLTASSSGGADLNADKLTADVCYAEASGGADAHVYGRKELYLRASGGADVTYSGPGQVMSRKKSGGGDISPN